MTDPLVPVVARNYDNRLEVFLVGQDRQLYHRWQTLEVDPTSWNDKWESLGGYWPSSAPVVAKNHDGSLGILGLGAYGEVDEKHQVSPNNGWSGGWYSFVDRPAGSVPVVATNQDGRLEVFILGGLGDRAGKLYHRWQTPGAAWNDTWEFMGGGSWESLPVVTNSGSRLEVFMVGQDGQLYHRWQTHANNGWNDKWETFGGDWPSTPVVAKNDDGRLEIFMVGRDRHLYHRWQTQKPTIDDAEVWTDRWDTLGGDWPSTPVLLSGYGTRQLMVFLVGQDRQLYHRWQEEGTRSGWNDTWESLGGYWPHTPVVIDHPSVRPMIFLVGQDRQLYYGYQDDTGVIQGWFSLGGDWSSVPVIREAYWETFRLMIFMVGQNGQLYHRWMLSDPVHPPEHWDGKLWNDTWESLGGYWPSY